MNLQLYGDTKAGFKATGESDGEHLEPCPFCGSEEVIVRNTHTPSYWAECMNCGAKGPNTTYPKREARSKSAVRRQHERAFREAVTLWNERVEQNWINES